MRGLSSTLLPPGLEALLDTDVPHEARGVILQGNGSCMSWARTG